jgi:hypothetical protein
MPKCGIWLLIRTRKRRTTMRRVKLRQEWYATMRLTDRDAEITRALAELHFDGNLSETMRTAIRRMATEYGIRAGENVAA